MPNIKILWTVSRHTHNQLYLLSAGHFVQYYLVFTYFQHKQLREILDSHSTDYKDWLLLGCKTMLTGSY